MNSKFRQLKNFLTINPSSNREGFSLVELMIVIAIIALIGGTVVSRVMSSFDKAKVGTTINQMRALGQILDEFNRECGFYPTTEQGLDALVQKPTAGRECKNYDPEGYIKNGKVPKDSFGNDFTYTSDGKKYRITSLGKDGQEGGDGVDKDINSDELE